MMPVDVEARMSVEELEGITPADVGQLRAVGVVDLADLLALGAQRRGRLALAAATGIDEVRLLAWVNAADLHRVADLHGEYVCLLGRAGVDTLTELRRRNPDHLYSRLQVTSAALRKTVLAAPEKQKVQSWIMEAGRLDPLVSF